MHYVLIASFLASVILSSSYATGSRLRDVLGMGAYCLACIVGILCAKHPGAMDQASFVALWLFGAAWAACLGGALVMLAFHAPFTYRTRVRWSRENK